MFVFNLYFVCSGRFESSNALEDFTVKERDPCHFVILLARKSCTDAFVVF